MQRQEFYMNSCTKRESEIDKPISIRMYFCPESIFNMKHPPSYVFKPI